MPRKTPARNNQVESSLASSTNGGQFANKKNAPADIVLTQDTNLPAGAEHIPAPVAGQTLRDGSPAPATFTEAWEQTFKPLHEMERVAGRKIESPHREYDRALLEAIGARDMRLGDKQEIEITRERLGSYLKITANATPKESGCDHPSTPNQELCRKMGCGCTHCVYLHAPEFAGFMDVAEGYDEWDEQETVELELKLSEEALASAKAWQVKVSGIADLVELKSKAEKAPWTILSATNVEEPKETPEVKEARAARDKADEDGKIFAGIDPRGWVNTRNDSYKDPTTLAYELESINKCLDTFARKPAKRGFDPVADQQRTIGYYKRIYEAREATIASIKSIEQELGRPLPEAITTPALESQEFGHRQYLYGYLKGAERKREIIAACVKSDNDCKEALEAEQAVVNEMERQHSWGAGWPEGAYDAPTREEWAAMTGAETEATQHSWV